MDVYNGLIVNIKFNEINEDKTIKVCPVCDKHSSDKFCSSCGTKLELKKITSKYYNSWWNIFNTYKFKYNLKCLVDQYGINKHTAILYQESYCTSGFSKEFSTTEICVLGSVKLLIKDYSDMIDRFKEYYKDLFNALDTEKIEYSIESSILLLDIND